ncbi:tyrosine-type recombinase/integrase [Serratia marcescens]|uniref:tyrosine-type recombinase/integrase n=1 Tax=Serratia marcescens TaxID=615 RepID=UPI00223792B0|nr:tyrosine-type recombinase/integrase [Serratia marcescens]MCW6015909.1 tyrosine-type recombinase/integrase [Serratia marcescens]MCW6023156.1 tyrosine-type recombinase/integrase [Serratia marcescens]
MLNQLFSNPDVLKRLTASSLGSLVQSYAGFLHAKKFSPSTMQHRIRAASHFGHWIDFQHIEINNINACDFEQFIVHLSDCSCPESRPGEHFHTAIGARRFLAYLSKMGAIPSYQPIHNEPSSQELLLDKFFQWTQLNRGISRQTGIAQRSHAVTVLHSLGDDPTGWEVRDIRQFVLSHFEQYQSSYIKTVGSNLRAFLRFLVVEGLCKPELIDAVPKTAHWTLSEIPRHISPESVDRVIAASSSLPRSELRDRAVISLLATLGLRARDVVNLCLSDIDWNQGRIRIMGKGRRETWLPLPQVAGDALLAYLEQERPPSNYNQVFLRSRVPFQPLKGIATVQKIVRLTLKHAGVERPSGVTTHLFRHSLARRLLEQNIPLEGIGVVLRHRNLQTTAQYAKIDIKLLQTVVQPWPEVKENCHVKSAC